MSCAVRAEADPSHLGLITGHAYSILKMVVTKCGKQFVQVRNPWGEHEWNGEYSDKSPMWTPALKEEVTLSLHPSMSTTMRVCANQKV